MIYHAEVSTFLSILRPLGQMRIFSKKNSAEKRFVSTIYEKILISSTKRSLLSVGKSFFTENLEKLKSVEKFFRIFLGGPPCSRNALLLKIKDGISVLKNWEKSLSVEAQKRDPLVCPQLLHAQKRMV